MRSTFTAQYLYSGVLVIRLKFSATSSLQAPIHPLIGHTAPLFGRSLTCARVIMRPFREFTHTSALILNAQSRGIGGIDLHTGSSASAASAAQLPVIERHE